MKSHLKCTNALRQEALADLRRPHAVAYERVGFLLARAAALPEGGVILIAYDYLPVDDGAYLPDEKIGARVSADGFRPARQAALRTPLSVIHVHLHEHAGPPGFSGLDSRETRAFMPDFLKVRGDQPHAALILSADEAVGRIWVRDRAVGQPITIISFIGGVITKVHHA
jgi:hypothetical protein